MYIYIHCIYIIITCNYIHFYTRWHIHVHVHVRVRSFDVENLKVNGVLSYLFRIWSFGMVWPVLVVCCFSIFSHVGLQSQSLNVNWFPKNSDVLNWFPQYFSWRGCIWGSRIFHRLLFFSTWSWKSEQSTSEDVRSQNRKLEHAFENKACVSGVTYDGQESCLHGFLR